MDPNKVITKLGNPGNYAKLIFLFTCFNYFPVSFNHLAMSVFGSAPDHRCALPEGLGYSNETVPINAKTGKLDSCLVYSNYSYSSGQNEVCPDGWVFSPYVTEIPYAPNESTVVNEFGLVCSDRWLVSLSTSIYFAGVMIGGVMFGAISDRVGRKPVMVFTLCMHVVLGSILCFVESFVVFIIIRCLIGCCMQGLQSTLYVLGMELFHDDRYRAYVGALMETAWSVGVMTLALFAWTLKSWRWIQLCLSLCPLLSLLYIWYMPESFRWLYNKKKFEKCQEYLIKAAKYNKVKLDPGLTENLRELATPAIPQEITRKPNITDMFRTPKLRMRSFILFYVWFATACGYYGLALNASELAGNQYINYFINGAIEFPAYFSGIWILSRCGRRIPLCIYFLIGGVSLIIAAVIPTETSSGQDIAWVSTLLAWIGRYSTAGCFSVIFLYSSEIYPTLIRNVGVGACAFCARFGSLVAPQILLLGDESEKWVPFVILGVIAILGGLVTLALPETMGLKLPDSVAQAEDLTSKDSTEKDQVPKNDEDNGNGDAVKKTYVDDKNVDAANKAHVDDKNVDVTLF